MKSYLVIGLGRFGQSVSRQLCALGAEVLVMDMHSDLVQHVANDVTHAVVGDAQDKEVLRALGARNFDCAIVAIGDNLAASVLITMNLKELEVPYIVCKAYDETHRRVLEKLLERPNRYHITSEMQDNIPLAAALHDIGKIAIDEKILNKPGRLTKEEFEVIKTHTTIGAEMLSKLANFSTEPLLQTAYSIARWHHERWDGCGYPDGLKGDEIPIEAQVVALADVYDALTSERCYKKAYPHRKAVDMILNGECGAFNPILLECFMEIEGDLALELEEKHVCGSKA